MGQDAYYPMFADLNGRRCVVIGGGVVAQRKVTTLLGYGAVITIVSPAVTKRLSAYARAGKVRHIARRFQPADLRGAWLVYAATDDQAINQQVFRAASAQRIFTNVVDQKPLCSFIAPAIARRGPVTVAVSTGGASPSLAKQIRDEVEEIIENGYLPMARLLKSLRGVAKRALPGYDDRKRYCDRLVRGGAFELVRRGRFGDARQAALRLLAQSNGRTLDARKKEKGKRKKTT